MTPPVATGWRRGVARWLAVVAALAPAAVGRAHPAPQPADSSAVADRPRGHAQERSRDRQRMVDRQIARGGPFRQPVTDARVLAAMRAVPRHEFVPRAMRWRAYEDTPLPIGEGQTISQPYIVALMTELLALRPGDKVLEIGTGSGYQAAVLAELTPHVFSIEIVPQLYERARSVLADLGYTTIRTRLGDGFDGWPEEAPFHAIIMTCAIDEVPDPLWRQLAPGGRLVLPLGDRSSTQDLVVLTKDAAGGRQLRRVVPVRFVPTTGKAQQQH
jgi:protein-L-isoaspartate(D-aspartate) O-methyltransferase